MLQAIQVHNVPHKQTPLAFTLLAIAVVMDRAIIQKAVFVRQAIQVPRVQQKRSMIAFTLLAIAVVMERVIRVQAVFVL